MTKRPKLKKRCDNVGHFVGFFVFSIALGCALFTLYMNTDAYRGDHVEINCANASVVPNKTADPPEMCKLDMGAALRTFGWARLTSFLVRALGLESAPHPWHAPEAAHQSTLGAIGSAPSPSPLDQPAVPRQGSTTAVLTIMFMFKRSVKIPCKKGEMVNLAADKAPSDTHRVRKKLGASIARLSLKEETDEEFEKRRDENEWRFPTYDELGPHPPCEPSIFSNTLKCCQNKVAPAEEGEVLERKEYYVGGEWVGWSKVGASTSPDPITGTSPSQNPLH